MQQWFLPLFLTFSFHLALSRYVARCEPCGLRNIKIHDESISVKQLRTRKGLIMENVSWYSQVLKYNIIF